MLIFAPALVLAALSPSAPDVRGASDCPSATLVAERLRPLLGAEEPFPAGTWLEVAAAPADEGAPAGVEIRLVREGRWLASRRLARAATCEETAQSLAVVAATWTARYAAVPRTQLVLPESGRPTGPGVVAYEPAPQADARRLSVGIGGGVMAAGTGTSAAALTAEVVARRSGHLRLRLWVAGVAERTLALDRGTAAWRRLVASPGVAWSWGSSEASVELGLGALAGAAFLEGRGFAENDSTVSFDLGAMPWVRASASLAAAPVTFWAGAAALAWARPQRVHVDGGARGASLPAVDLMLGGGLLWTVGGARPSAP